MKKNILTLLVFMTTSVFFYAQNFDKDKLNAYFDTLSKHNKFMGSIAISQNGKLIYTKSVGFADIEKGIKNTEKTIFRVGSISKTFTTVLVFKAIEEKKLKLDQKLSSFFPSVKNANSITIEQMLRHRSGIFNITDDKDYFQWHTSAKSKKEIIEMIEKYESVFEPDSKSQYSNSNYILLSYILEKVFNKSFSELITTYITKPLGMKNTKISEKINPLNHEAYSYIALNGWGKSPETDLSFVLGAGSIISTATDLTLFSDALFGNKLIKREHLEMMKTLKDDYGMGLFQFPFYEKRSFGHTGGIDGFYSIFCYYEKEGISHVRLSNGTNMIPNDIDIATLSILFNKPYTIPTFKIFDVSAEDLNKYIGVYTSSEIPLKITISKEGNTLKAQATGQPAFTLEPTEKHIFKFDLANLEMVFNPDDNTMTLKQLGAIFNFKKE